MKKVSILIIYLLIFLVAGCRGSGQKASETKRAEKPAFKGIELYSWQTSGDEWNFSVLPGTNRNKTLEEIKDSAVTYTNVDDLKRRLSILAKGEQVIWANLSSSPVPKDIINDITEYCERLDIQISGPYQHTIK